METCLMGMIAERRMRNRIIKTPHAPWKPWKEKTIHQYSKIIKNAIFLPNHFISQTSDSSWLVHSGLAVTSIFNWELYQNKLIIIAAFCFLVIEIFAEIQQEQTLNIFERLSWAYSWSSQHNNSFTKTIFTIFWSNWETWQNVSGVHFGAIMMFLHRKALQLLVRLAENFSFRKFYVLFNPRSVRETLFLWFLWENFISLSLFSQFFRFQLIHFPIFRSTSVELLWSVELDQFLKLVMRILHFCETLGKNLGDFLIKSAKNMYNLARL